MVISIITISWARSACGRHVEENRKMETKIASTKQHPKESANLIGQLFYTWTKEMFWKGAKEDLVLSDLSHPLEEDESARLGDRLEESWNYELLKWEQKRKEAHYAEKSDGMEDEPSLRNALIRTFWKGYLCAGLISAVQYVGIHTLIPLLLSWVINYFNTDNGAKSTTQTEALTYAGCLIFGVTMNIFIMHHVELRSQQIGMKIRVACSSLIYRKIFRLSKSALTQVNPGQIVNLLSNDVSRFDELSYYLNFTWITPIQVILVGAIVWRKVGISSIIGIAALIIMAMPAHLLTIMMAPVLRKRTAALTDKRVEHMNVLIGGIQVIKMYAWEKPVEKIVAAIRAAELKAIRYTAFIRAAYFSLAVFSNRSVLFITLLLFVLTGNRPKAELTYMLASYYEILQLTTMLFFPQGLLLGGETMVSIRRIQAFLLLEEHSNASVKHANTQNGLLRFKKRKIEKNNVESIKLTDATERSIADSQVEERKKPVSIILKRASANWTPMQLPPTLCNVSMKIQGGELCALVGPVGSGKSSILQLLLKELPLGAGILNLSCESLGDTKQDEGGYTVDTPNLRISYASQDAWLFSGTVRDNILFGQPYNKDRYVAVTKACALTKDFQQFPYGDMSNVGEGGSALSGGQKARVNLARAVYRQADIYLLDDPLSAVDARVARHLFHKCIKQHLHGKTRILVTHQLQFVKQADTIAVLDRGSIRMQGTYEELSKTNEDFAEMMNFIKMSTESRKQSECVETFGNSSVERRASRKSCLRISVTSNASSTTSYNYEDQESAPDNEEMMAKGRLPGKVYVRYFRHGGSWWTLSALLLMFVISQAATSGNDYWVSYWTNLESIRESTRNGTGPIDPQYSSFALNGTHFSYVFSLDSNGLLTTSNSLCIYAICIACCTLTVLARNMSFTVLCIEANKSLHDSMFSNVLQATTRFFNANNSGRILNRFSKDVGAVDEILPRVMLETIQICIVLIGVFTMVVSVNRWMIIPLVVLLVLFFCSRHVYIRTVQNVRRLEAVAKSPVFSHVNATLNGLTTIRSSGADIMQLLRKQFDDLEDVHSGAWYMGLAAPAAFGLYLDIGVTSFIACICFSFVLMNTGGTLAGNVGLALAQSVTVVGALQHGVKQSGEVVSQITAVERILQYTDLPKEASWTSDNPPQNTWPKYGQLTLKNVSLRYQKDEPPVLKNLNVSIEAGWKVGVVGRTGAGKSSLISTLFRLFDDGLEGEIKIDGRDTATLGLHELRSRLSIIPQQPFLFSATLRYNLDPFNVYDDARLWDSLRQVELNDMLLDQKVMANGSNLSIGQRQLICLARAILRNNRILVLDEATANIDTYTDDLIQKTIRTRFADCTVITIAHRLNTIIDSDRVIVMDAGSIAEFGCPYELLRNKPDQIFSQMVNNTGVSMAQSLRDQAEQAYLRNTKRTSLDLNRRGSEEGDIIAQSSL